MARRSHSREREIREHIARELLTQRRGAWGKPEVFGQGKTLPPRECTFIPVYAIFRDRAGTLFKNRGENCERLKVKVSDTEERILKEQSLHGFFVFLSEIRCCAQLYLQLYLLIGNQILKDSRVLKI